MAESGVVVTMAGGKWQLDGDQYFEMVEYGRGRDYADLKGQTLRFTCRIVGNRWFHSGSFAGGLSFNQIWERVELGDPIKK